MTGRRLPDNPKPSYWPELAPGDYWRMNDQTWYFKTPNGIIGTFSSKIHVVLEHEDGTITVTPSLVIPPYPDYHDGWHGYLTHGIWRQCC